MANYTSEAEIEYVLGISIDTNSRPTTTQLGEMLADADAIINAQARVSSNMTDTYGILNRIAKDLVLKQINNMWSFTNPEQFPYIDIELTDAQKVQINAVHRKFAGESWEIGS